MLLVYNMEFVNLFGSNGPESGGRVPTGNCHGLKGIRATLHGSPDGRRRVFVSRSEKPKAIEAGCVDQHANIVFSQLST
jgi:hypothetical protein